MLAIVPKQETVEQEHQAPIKYVVVQRAQHCACCGSTHEWSEVYSWNQLPSRVSGLSRAVTNLKSIVWPKYRLPIDKVPVQRTEMIPFCHKCNEPSLDHEGSPQRPTQLMEPMRQPKTPYPVIVSGAQEAPNTPQPMAKPRQPKPQATVSDLEALL